MIADFGDIAAQAWDKCKTSLDRLYDLLTYEHWRDQPSDTMYRIWTDDGMQYCHLCGADDKWVLEGDTAEISKVFVCEHEPVMGCKHSCRQVSSVPKRIVRYAEVTWSPSE